MLVCRMEIVFSTVHFPRLCSSSFEADTVAVLVDDAEAVIFVFAVFCAFTYLVLTVFAESHRTCLCPLL